MWTCSWQEHYITDSKELYLPGYDCAKNNLTLKKIPPFETTEKLLLFLDSKNKNQLSNIKFKVGFKLYRVPEKEATAIGYGDGLSKYLNPENELTLWSSTLELK